MRRLAALLLAALVAPPLALFAEAGSPPEPPPCACITLPVVGRAPIQHGISAAANPSAGLLYFVNDTHVEYVDSGTNLERALVQTPVQQRSAIATPIAVDAALHRLYVSLPREDQLLVLDAEARAWIPAQVVHVGDGPASVAADEGNHRVFVSNAGSGSVSILDGVTLQVLAEVPLATEPRNIAFNPLTHAAYVLGTDRVTKLAGADGALLAERLLPDPGPHFDIVVNPATGRLYVPNYLAATLTVLDATNLDVLATLPMPPFPWGLAIDSVANRLLVLSQSNTLWFFNGTTEQPQSFAIMDGWTDLHYVAYDPLRGRAAVACFCTFDGQGLLGQPVVVEVLRAFHS